MVHYYYLLLVALGVCSGVFFTAEVREFPLIDSYFVRILFCSIFIDWSVWAVVCRRLIM